MYFAFFAMKCHINKSGAWGEVFCSLLYLLIKTRCLEPGAGRGSPLPNSDEEKGPSA